MPSHLKTYARRYLIYTHRYLGIALGLMLVVWFASGIVMMYAGGMPRLGVELRLARLAPLDLAVVAVTPAEAARKAAAGRGAQATLLMVEGRPAYRFAGRDPATVFADDGTRLDPVDALAARGIAARFAGVADSDVQFERTVDSPDQWTLGQGRLMPLHKFRVADDAGTQLYVAAATAEVVQLTTRRARALAWVGTIPHWIYFAALKTNQPVWYRTVVWLSSAGCVVAVLGLVLAFTQFRRTRPFKLSLAIPYRKWMRWHYIGGALFGVFALTWAFSGLMSMEPFAWTNARGLEIDRQGFSGGPVNLAGYGMFDAAALQRAAGADVIKEIGFTRIQGEQYYSVRAVPASPSQDGPRERLHQPYVVTGGRDETRSLLVAAKTLVPLSEAFSTDSIVERLGKAANGTRIVEVATLDDYDSYYYSRGRQRALPVLRVKFGDPAQTWVYVDPRTSSIVAQVHRYSRLERWLYNGLHSLDFKFWYGKRPWWDLGMLTLLLGAMATSGLGTYLGIKRLIKDLRPKRAVQQP